MIPKRLKYAFKVLLNPSIYEENEENKFHLNKLRTDFYLLYKENVTYCGDHLYTHHSADFLTDQKFVESYELGSSTDEGILLKDTDIRWRIHLMCWAANHAKNLEGDFVDCGVNSGIFARSVIHYTDFKNTNKKYYLLDTFEGMDPKYSTEKEMLKSDIIGYGAHTNVYERVKNTFKDFNTKIIKGAIPETLPLVDTEKIAYLLIDMNCVMPEVEALNYFWDKMVSGGIIILDDYGYMNSQKEQKAAHDTFAKSKGVEILYFPTCQGVIIKP
jgi:hypothetical protein